MTDKDSNQNEQFDPSRRKFVKNTGILAGGVIGGGVLGGLFTHQFQKPEPNVKNTDTALQEARVFFDRKEDFETLSAAVERIFPKDDLGPGAIELAVPYFIDKQLNGFWGHNAYAYMKGPFIQSDFVRDYEKKDSDQSKQGPNTNVFPSIPAPRYQTRMNRGEVFLAGLRRIEEVSQEKFKEKFTKLEPEQQDEILTMFEKGEVEIPGVHTKPFFHLLVQTTLEGAYADPVYGGNKNMAGWKMKQYPGPRMAYYNDIESEEFIEMEQKSLKDYQGS